MRHILNNWNQNYESLSVKCNQPSSQAIPWITSRSVRFILYFFTAISVVCYAFIFFNFKTFMEQVSTCWGFCFTYYHVVYKLLIREDRSLLLKSIFVLCLIFWVCSCSRGFLSVMARQPRNSTLNLSQNSKSLLMLTKHQGVYKKRLTRLTGAEKG